MVDCDPSYQTVKSGIGERLSAQLTIGNDWVPMLPTGYPPMTATAMIPPLWRRVFNPRVRAWRRQFYPEIHEWSAYKTLSHQPSNSAG